MHINNDSYKNLPDKFSRQHHEFTIGGEDSSNPVAQVRNPTYVDMLVEFEMLEPNQQKTILLFSVYRDMTLNGVGMRTMRYDEFIADNERMAVEVLHDDERLPSDIYRLILRALTKQQVEILLMLLTKPPLIKPEQKHKYKDVFWTMVGDIERIVKLIDGVVYGER